MLQAPQNGFSNMKREHCSNVRPASLWHGLSNIPGVDISQELPERNWQYYRPEDSLLRYVICSCANDVPLDKLSELKIIQLK